MLNIYWKHIYWACTHAGLWLIFPNICIGNWSILSSNISFDSQSTLVGKTYSEFSFPFPVLSLKNLMRITFRCLPVGFCSWLQIVPSIQRFNLYCKMLPNLLSLATEWVNLIVCGNINVWRMSVHVKFLLLFSHWVLKHASTLQLSGRWI